MLSNRNKFDNFLKNLNRAIQFELRLYASVVGMGGCCSNPEKGTIQTIVTFWYIQFGDVWAGHSFSFMSNPCNQAVFDANAKAVRLTNFQLTPFWMCAIFKMTIIGNYMLWWIDKKNICESDERKNIFKRKKIKLKKEKQNEKKKLCTKREKVQ